MRRLVLLVSVSALAAMATAGCSWLKPNGGEAPLAAADMLAGENYASSLSANAAQTPAGHLAANASAIGSAPTIDAGGANNPLNQLVDNVSSLMPKTADPEAVLRGRIAAGRLLEKQQRYTDAETLYNQLVVDRPDAAAPRQRLGLVVAKQSRYEEAENHLREAARLEPKNAAILADLGYLQYLQHRLPEAEQTLRASLQLAPNSKRSLNNLGLVVGGQSRFDESFEIFRRAGSEAEAHANMGYVLAQVGDLKGSQQAYLKALSLDTGLRKAAEAMLQVAAREQELVKTKAAPGSEEAPKRKTLSSAIAANLDRAERRRREQTAAPVNQTPQGLTTRLAPTGGANPGVAAASYITPVGVTPDVPINVTPGGPTPVGTQNQYIAPQINAAARGAGQPAPIVPPQYAPSTFTPAHPIHQHVAPAQRPGAQ